MRPLGRIDQQVVQQLCAADQQVGHPVARQLRFGDEIAAALPDGLLDLRQLPVDVADHRLGALAQCRLRRDLHGLHSGGRHQPKR